MSCSLSACHCRDRCSIFVGEALGVSAETELIESGWPQAAPHVESNEDLFVEGISLAAQAGFRFEGTTRGILETCSCLLRKEH